MKTVNQFVDISEKTKDKYSCHKRWKAAYELLEAKCLPHWKEYDKVRKPFYDNYRKSDGCFHDLHDKVLGKAYAKYLKDTKPYMDGYLREIKKISQRYNNGEIKDILSANSR